MTKTKKPILRNFCPDQQPWLFPELRSWQQTSQLNPLPESLLSNVSSKKSELNTQNTSVTMHEVLVSIGDSGRPVGESAPNAKYTDAEIDMVFELRNQGYFYREISEMMDMPVRTIRTVLDGSRRNKHVVGWKKLKRKAKK